MHRNAENISIFHSENPYLSDAVKFRIIRKSIIDDRVNKNSLMSKIRQ